MAWSDIKVDISQEDVDELIYSVDGPVGELIAELSEKATNIARAAVHVMPGTRRSGYWNERSTAVRPPGTTKASIERHGPVRGSRGGMYGGVNAPMAPTVFLEHPAEQMYDRYPFLTTAIDELTL